MDRKKILMIQPPFKELKFGNEWEGTDTLAPPLGLMYLGTPLINEGFDVKFIDFNVDKFSESEFLKFISDSDFLLLSCFSSTIKNIYKIINIAKKVNPSIYIICGGPYPKLTGNHILGSDLTVIGEAEDFITIIIEKIINKDSLSDIPGLIYKKGGKIIKNKGFLLIKDLDSSKSSEKILAKGKDYGYFFGYKIKGLSGIMTSRGCPFNCYFCTHRGVFDSKQVRKRSVENIVSELKELQSNGTKYVIFYDENFLLDKKRVMELMDRIIEEKIKLKFVIQGRVDSADFDLYKKLYKAGVMMILLGIENANQDVLDFYNKGINIEQIEKAIILANKVGIFTMGYFMIGSPVEEKEHFNVNKKFIKKMPLDAIYISILAYEEGSFLWSKAVKEGKIRKDQITVNANESLSNYSYNEWLKMKDELYKGFYSPSRITRFFYKAAKADILIAFTKFFWNGKKGLFGKRKTSFYIGNPKEKIELSNIN